MPLCARCIFLTVRLTYNCLLVYRVYVDIIYGLFAASLFCSLVHFMVS